MTKWTYNSPAVISTITESDSTAAIVKLDIGDISSAPIERALGVLWDIKSDQMKFSVEVRERPATRRGILSVMSSIYDPLGFVAPILLPVKIILQDLCRKRLTWDDPIPEDCLLKWKKWLFDLPHLEKFNIDRCIKPMNKDEIVSCELHHFCDASEVGYGAVVYLRLVTVSGNIYIAFIMGKSRAAPLKTMTIPRLELTAATLSVRLDRIVRIEMDFDITRSAVLKFIRNKDKRFHTMVANRIAMIHDGSEVTSWRHVKSNLNPADDASRGMSVESIIGRSRWSMGPGFLSQTEEHWPEQPECVATLESDHPEVKKSCATVLNPDPEATTSDHLTNILEHFSSWYQLKKCVSWLLRYQNCLQEAARLRKSGTPRDYMKGDIDPLSVDELNNAEKYILLFVQKQAYPDELKC